MLEQVRDLALHFLELIQLQIGIENREHVAGFAVLVDEDAPAALGGLAADFQDAFALQHHGQDVTGGTEPRIIFLHQLGQQRLRRVFWIASGGAAGGA